MMNKRLVIAIIGIVCVLTAFAGNKVDPMYEYEIVSFEGAVAPSAGWHVVKVWSYGKRESLTRENNMKNAVHGVLFKGYPKLGANAGLKALVPEGYEAHKEFFDEFFRGKFMQYVQVTNNGNLAAGDVVKIDKKRYKVGMVVVVNVNGLRKYLEDEKIIEPLDFLFN